MNITLTLIISSLAACLTLISIFITTKKMKNICKKCPAFIKTKNGRKRCAITGLFISKQCSASIEQLQNTIKQLLQTKLSCQDCPLNYQENHPNKTKCAIHNQYVNKINNCSIPNAIPNATKFIKQLIKQKENK